MGQFPIRVDLRIWGRDTYVGEVNFVDLETGAVVDMSGWSAWGAKLRQVDDGAEVEAFSLSTGDTNVGVIGLELDEADVAALLPARTLAKDYLWDLYGQNADGEVHTTHAGLAVVTVDPRVLSG